LQHNNTFEYLILYLKAALLYLNRLIIFVAALQILNLSVCGGDAVYSSDNTSAIGEINQIDCFVEYIAEEVLNYKDVIAENGLHNTSGNHSIIIKHILSNKFQQGFSIVTPKITSLAIPAVPFKEAYTCLYCREIIPPPPKA